MEITGNTNSEEIPDMTNDVTNFVVRELGVKRDRLTLDTRILHDLDVDFEDADKFLQEFCDTYGVDLAKFQFDKYFNSEYGSALWGMITVLLLPFFLAQGIYWSFNKKAGQEYKERQNADKLPLTIRDLVQAATTKKWPELPN